MSHPPTVDTRRARSRLPRLTRTRVCVAMLMLAVTTLAGTAPAARAESGVLPDLACTFNFQLNLSPPLTATNTTADVLGQAGGVNCLSPSGEYPDLQSGAVVDAPGSATSLGGVPCGLLLTIEGSGEFEWNTGEVSEFDYSVNTNPLAGTITLRADVTSGPLAGTTATAVPVLASVNPDCALVGLKYLASELTEVVFI